MCNALTLIFAVGKQKADNNSIRLLVRQTNNDRKPKREWESKSREQANNEWFWNVRSNHEPIEQSNVAFRWCLFFFYYFFFNTSWHMLWLTWPHQLTLFELNTLTEWLSICRFPDNSYLRFVQRTTCARCNFKNDSKQKVIKWEKNVQYIYWTFGVQSNDLINKIFNKVFLKPTFYCHTSQLANVIIKYESMCGGDSIKILNSHQGIIKQNKQ